MSNWYNIMLSELKLLMLERLKPPEGSRILINANEDFTEIHWEKYPKLSRYFLAFVPGVILTMSIPAILTWTLKIINHQSNWFKNIILGCLVLLNIKMLLSIWKFVHPTVPESIWFNTERIEIRLGEHPFELKNIGTYSFSLSDCPEFLLQSVGSKQRLCFYVTDIPVVIGVGLSNKEREWIYDVVNNWKIG